VKHQTTAIAIALMILTGSTAMFAMRNGNTIRVHCAGCDISAQLGHLNSLLAPANVRLEASEAGAADVTISLVSADQMPKPGTPNAVAAGAANPLTGHIDIDSYYANSQYGYVVILHEIIHCAGVGHEPEDPSSLMHTEAHVFGELKQHHIRALRRLSGITPPERVAALIFVVFS
jgi:hypothetical protein